MSGTYFTSPESSSCSDVDGDVDGSGKLQAGMDDIRMMGRSVVLDFMGIFLDRLIRLAGLFEMP